MIIELGGLLTAHLTHGSRGQYLLVGALEGVLIAMRGRSEGVNERRVDLE